MHLRMDLKFTALSVKNLVVALLFMSSIQLFAQSRETESKPLSPKRSGFDWDRLVLGGNFGAQFGDVTYAEISPTLGYLITENWLGGVGAKYIFYENKLFRPIINTNIYGGGLFTQYYFLENFIAHLEYELINLDDFNDREKRTNISSLFVGGGYRSMIGNNSFASILLLYNLNDDINSPYTNPIIRVNIGFGL